VLELAFCLFSALVSLRQLGYMHRDLCQANVLYCEKRLPRFKIGDFGLCVPVPKPSAKPPTFFSFASDAPETRDAKAPVTEKADIW
jgi:serine/threonine protein kinase